MKRTLTTLVCVSLAACSAVGTATHTQLDAVGDNYVANRALDNFYEFNLVRTDGGNREPELNSVAEAAAELANYDVVFIGEAHGHPGNHLAQMQLFEQIYRHAPELTLSMEQFNRDAQQVVDEYLAGEIGEWTLRKKGSAWDNYGSSYRPLVNFAKRQQLPVLAAEVPVHIVACVGKQGAGYLDTLSDLERSYAASELNIDTDSGYFKKYAKFVSGSATHGKSASHDETESEGISPQVLNSYTGQVLRDDTMAETIFWHMEKNPGRKVVHLNGSFHSDSFMGTVERLKLRAPSLKIAVVSPVEVKDPTAPSLNKSDVAKGTYILQIHPTEPEVIKAENRKTWIRDIMGRREKREC